MRARINERCLINTHEVRNHESPGRSSSFTAGREKCESVCVRDHRAVLPLVAPSPPWQWCIRCALTQSTRAHYELAAMPHASCCSWQLATDNKWQLQLFVWFLINAFAQCLSNYAFGAMPPHNGYGNWKLATGNGNWEQAATTRGASSTAAASRSSCRMNNSCRGRSSHGN